MFCPSCGFEYTHKTNYCKRCGEGLNAAPQSAEIKTPRFQAVGIFSVVALFGIVGLFLNLLSLHYLFRDGRVDGTDAMVSFALGLFFVGGIAGFLIRQLSRMITAYQKSSQTQAQERVIIREAQVQRLGAPTDQVRSIVEPSSVVEHTTRQMAGGYGEPKVTKYGTGSVIDLNPDQ
jgi:hypothetical protein